MFNLFSKKCEHKNYVKHNWFSFDGYPMTCWKCVDCNHLYYDYVNIDRNKWKTEVVWNIGVIK